MKNTKLTALQSLIVWGDEMLSTHPNKHLSFAEVIDKAVTLLELEKEQMQEVAKASYIEAAKYHSTFYEFSKSRDIYSAEIFAEKYYADTYKIMI